MRGGDEVPAEGGAGLLLRPWHESDVAGFRAAIDEDVGHVRPWLSWTLEEPAGEERTRERLRAWVEDFEAGRGFRFAITRGGDPRTILGGASLNRRVGPAAHDIGYWVRASATRRGVATAAASRLVVHAFEGRVIERLVSRCDVANERSSAMARALGFRPCGEVMVAYPDGSPRPVLEFELTREEYRRGLQHAFHERARDVGLETSRR